MRDSVRDKTGALCIEMSAAGVAAWDETNPLPIKGISDYADSHKTDDMAPWRSYAAATAAAYVRELLYSMDPGLLMDMNANQPHLCNSETHFFHSVPLETVHSYTERYGLSSAIEEKLHKCHENNSILHALAIYGLGGTGKTQLALKYIESHKSDYNPILRIDAQDSETVRSSFERCAAELQLSVDITSKKESVLADSAIVQAVLKWLQNRKESDDEWLIVFDNADDVTWGLNKVLPKGRRGNVIITSQDNQSPRLFKGGCETLRVDTMEHLEARALLLRHLERDLNPAPQHVQLICDEIVERLGYLALAIDLAGAYISNDSNQEVALKQYLADYGKHRDELLRSDYFQGLSVSDKTVWTVWDTTLEKIEGKYPDVRSGLAFLAYFSQGIIEDELFRLVSLGSSVFDRKPGQRDRDCPDWLKQLIKFDGQEWDSFYYHRKLLEPLVRYSLVQRVNGEWPGVIIHGLVQWRAMEYEKNQSWRLWYLISAACYQVSEEKARPQFRRHMIKHIPSVSDFHLDDIGIDKETKLIVCNTISGVYYKEGRWKEAEELFVQVMETSLRVLGEEHPSTLTSMANLAHSYKAQNRTHKAIELMKEVIELRSKVIGANHPHIIAFINSCESWVAM